MTTTVTTESPSDIAPTCDNSACSNKGTFRILSTRRHTSIYHGVALVACGKHLSWAVKRAGDDCEVNEIER